MFNNFTLNVEQALPNGVGLLAEVRPNTIFVDKKPVGEDGIRVTVLSLEDFSKIVVKIPGAKSPIDPDELKERNLRAQFTFARFTGFKAKLWQDFATHEMHLSATATGVEIVDDDDIIDIFDSKE